MAIAGAVVVPYSKDTEEGLKKKLMNLSEVTVQDTGPKGVAIVIEAPSVDRLKDLSEEISKWEEVVAFELVYLNWQ